MAKHTAEQASFVFGLISLMSGIVLGAISAYLTLVTGGWGVFFAGAALGAAAPIVIASWGASYWFGTFDGGAAGDPAYFATFQRHIVDAVGLTSVLTLALGTLMSFLFGKSVGALMDAGRSVAKLLTVEGATLFAAGLSAGLVVGALATLLILAPLSGWYLQRMRALLYGNESQCGNYDYDVDVLCPAAA